MVAVPELRMESGDRQSTEYEVHHQKLVKLSHIYTLETNNTHKWLLKVDFLMKL